MSSLQVQQGSRESGEDVPGSKDGMRRSSAVRCSETLRVAGLVTFGPGAPGWLWWMNTPNRLLVRQESVATSPGREGRENKTDQGLWKFGE